MVIIPYTDVFIISNGGVPIIPATDLGIVSDWYKDSGKYDIAKAYSS